MERLERVFSNMEATDCVDTKQSKQRASIKWLLSKAFNNRVPENLQEPFYRDHEDQEHLKPPIVGGLANAELYCLALANMYSDPNYHSLNHWNILQTLARKGVHVPDPPDCALTETVLIQTNPLKISAHMSVIEALMVLYAREVVTLDRVAAAAQRFGVAQPLPAGSGTPHEDGLLCWINSACTALNKAEEETSSHVPTVASLQDVCDGTALAALVSFYCPEALRRGSVRVGRLASIQDCLHNLMLVHDFCTNCLPHNVFHMLPEDVTYMRGSMRQNLIAMLADLFNMLEVHPVKSVKNPSSGPRLYKQPATKSNRGIMLNAVEYCVFPGAVNAEAKRRVLEEVARSESKHFLVLFRDAGCQFRALYSYCPDTDSVDKLYGTGPKHVNDRMFDKFFKYNSGSKCFSQVHTKHLTVTIDAFTIHNSLWQGKKVQLPSKKDMALVI